MATANLTKEDACVIAGKCRIDPSFLIQVIERAPKTYIGSPITLLFPFGTKLYIEKEGEEFTYKLHGYAHDLSDVLFALRLLDNESGFAAW